MYLLDGSIWLFFWQECHILARWLVKKLGWLPRNFHWQLKVGWIKLMRCLINHSCFEAMARRLHDSSSNLTFKQLPVLILPEGLKTSLVELPLREWAMTLFHLSSSNLPLLPRTQPSKERCRNDVDDIISWIQCQDILSSTLRMKSFSTTQQWGQFETQGHHGVCWLTLYMKSLAVTMYWTWSSSSPEGQTPFQ